MSTLAKELGLTIDELLAVLSICPQYENPTASSSLIFNAAQRVRRRATEWAVVRREVPAASLRRRGKRPPVFSVGYYAKREWQDPQTGVALFLRPGSTVDYARIAKMLRLTPGRAALALAMAEDALPRPVLERLIANVDSLGSTYIDPDLKDFFTFRDAQCKRTIGESVADRVDALLRFCPLCERRYIEAVEWPAADGPCPACRPDRDARGDFRRVVETGRRVRLRG